MQIHITIFVILWDGRGGGGALTTLLFLAMGLYSTRFCTSWLLICKRTQNLISISNLISTGVNFYWQLMSFQLFTKNTSTFSTFKFDYWILILNVKEGDLSLLECWFGDRYVYSTEGLRGWQAWWILQIKQIRVHHWGVEGLRWKMVFSSRYCSGMTGLMTCSFRSAAISSLVTVSSCWVEIRTVCTRTGTIAPCSLRYTTVTCQSQHLIIS